MGDYRGLLAYKKGYELATRVFKISESFPADERFRLTDQIRRSTRSVCSNLAEGYRRRTYKKYFLSKLNDAQTENTETQVWLDLALSCDYITNELYNELTGLNNEVGKLIWNMIKHPDKFL